MILIDANLLIYAYNQAAEQHVSAKKWLEDVFSGTEPLRLSWGVIHAFLRLTTQRIFVAQPLSMSEAAAIVQEWLEAPNMDVLQPGTRYWTILRQLLIDAQIRGPMVMDADLAALAVEHGATLYTSDKDFTRFDGLRVINPLRRE